jgi:hypothetical protein
MSAPLVLVSHALCPYVQRAAIVLAEKGAAFERRWVDLADKPAWFRAVSPLGKTPVLLVGDAALFESAVICEYLDETIAPRLLPDDAIARARERGWIALASAMLDAIAAYYNAADDAALARHSATARGSPTRASASSTPRSRRSFATSTPSNASTASHGCPMRRTSPRGAIGSRRARRCAMRRSPTTRSACWRSSRRAAARCHGAWQRSRSAPAARLATMARGRHHARARQGALLRRQRVLRRR